jgi:hypothetical protein
MVRGRVGTICASFESESDEESLYVLAGTIRVLGVAFEVFGIKGDMGDSSDDWEDTDGSMEDCCLWSLVRCRVVKEVGTDGFLLSEDSLAGQVVGGQPGGSRDSRLNKQHKFRFC